MINETNDKIRYTSFKSFLEKGYEATSIRDICKEVDIKPSTLYFYYESKCDLFLSIYDEILDRKIAFLVNINVLNDNLSLELKIKWLYKEILNYCSKNILNEKFLLRYHLFPAEEIISSTKDRYNYWKTEENKALLQFIYKYNDKEVFNNDTIINNFLFLYKDFLAHQEINMVINNIKPTTQEIEMYWGRFWNSYILNLQNK
jgi:AcrR family transcriptional regulator